MRWHWKRRGQLVLALAGLLLGGCATLPTEYREPPALAAEQRAALNARVFERVWRLVNDRYFDAHFRGNDWRALYDRYRPEAVAAVDDAALYAVLNRMCAELKESHLTALSPRQSHEEATDHRAAVGIRWQRSEGRRVVTDVVPGGPAERAGVQRGWLVVSRNGMALSDGEVFISHVGQPVTYGFLDEHDRLRTVSLEPELIQFERLEALELDHDLVYLRFDRFSRETLTWLSRQLKAHATAPGVVVDLRQNSGGNALALSVALAEFFPRRVAEGRMVRRDGTPRESYSLAWRSARYGGEVVLLTSPYTASAAEIFSHVLQHHGRAKVMGRRTAGAVIFSRTYTLPDGGRIQIPVVDYVGLDGERLEGHGVIPDQVTAPASLAELRAGRDPEVAAAVAALAADVADRRAPPVGEDQGAATPGEGVAK